MKTRILACLLSLLMLVSLIPVSVSAADAEVPAPIDGVLTLVEGQTYTLNSDSVDLSTVTEIVGNGATIKVGYRTGGESAAIAFYGRSNETLKVTGVRIEGTSKTAGERGIVVTTNGNSNIELIVEDCEFATLTTGIFLGAVTNAEITDCSFDYCAAAIGGSELISEKLVVDTCEFDNNTETIGWAGKGTLEVANSPTLTNFNSYVGGTQTEVTVTGGAGEWVTDATTNTVGSACAEVNGQTCGSLASAITAANDAGTANVKLLSNVELGEKLTITGDVTIEGAYTITRAAAYTGTLFEVKAGATLTLDGNLVIDGNNQYQFNSALYEKDLADWNKSVPSDESTKWFTPEAGAPVATAYMMTVGGDNSALNLNNVSVVNHYSTNGSGIVSASRGATVTLTGAKFTHNASTNGSGLIVNASGSVWSREDELITVVMNKGTVIDGNHVGGNHGIFKIYMGTYFTMNGGEIKNTTGWNSNGSAIGIYHAVFTMNDGLICSNSSVYGPNNGRNAAIYGHSNHLFTMNGGTICHNTGRARAGIDSPYSETGYTGLTVINGGTVIDNTVLGTWTEPDVSGGATLTITGGTFTQDVSKWCAEGYAAPYDEATGTYTVVVHTDEQCAPVTKSNADGHWTECSVCGDILSESVAHTSEYATNSTHHWTACADCGYVLGAEEEHTFEKGVCTVCGGEEEGYVAPPAFDYVLFALAARYSQKFDVIVSADNATVTGDMTIKYKRNGTVDIAVADGYKLVDVIANGQSLGAVETVTFKKVMGPQTLVVVTEALYTNPYADIADDNAAVQYVTENGIMTAVEEGKFAPEAEATRALIADVLYALAGKPEFEATVTVNDSDAAAILWAASNGIITPDADGLVKADTVITMADLNAALNAYAGTTDADYIGLDAEAAAVAATRADVANTVYLFCTIHAEG